MNWPKALLTYTFCAFFSMTVAQSPVDSLQNLLKSASSDTLRVEYLIQLSKALYNTKPEDAIRYGQQAKDLATKIDYQRGIGYALKHIGLAYYAQGNYPEVLAHWDEALKVFVQINDKLGEANLRNNIGAVYFDKGDYVHAVEYYLRSLKLSEELNDTLRIATALMNIGSVYNNDPNTYDKAMEYYNRALKLSQSIQEFEAIGSSAASLGQLHMEMKDYDRGLHYFTLSREAYEKLGDTHNLPYTLAALGKLHAAKGDYGVAIKYEEEAIELATRYGYKLELLRSQIQLADTYVLSKQTHLALQQYLDAEKLGRELEARFELKNIYEGLSKLYAQQGDFKSAHRYKELLIDVKDLLYSDDNAKKVSQMQFEFDLEKKESEIQLLTKDNEFRELELEKQKVTRNALILGIGLLVLLAFFLYRNYKVKEKSNKMLAAQNYEINQQKEEIEAQRDDIDDQKKEIENLILNILPLEVAQELRKTGKATPQYYESVTVLFTDFKEFTRMSEFMSAQDLVAELNECFIAFDEIIGEYGLEKIKTIGDAYMCACGIPTPIDDHPARTVRAALAIQKYIADQNEKRIVRGTQLWELRIGIHTGPVIAGVVGRKKFAYDIWGSTVNVANRLESNGLEGKVNISEATYQLIKEEFECRHRGKITAKSLGEVDMYFVERDLKG
jgi:adenylate cyclase